MQDKFTKVHVEMSTKVLAVQTEDYQLMLELKNHGVTKAKLAPKSPTI